MAFDWNRFQDNAYLQEGLYLDRKAEYKLDDCTRVDVIQDLIAFSNTSRLTGQECCLLLGVSDDFTRAGIPGIPTDPDKRLKAWDSYIRKLNNWAKEFVDPALIIDAGVLREIDGKFFAVLTFSPTSHPTPFVAKKDVRKDARTKAGKEIKKGQAWIRSAESNLEIKPDHIYNHLNFNRVPLLLPREWIRYCESQLKDPNERDNIPNEMIQRLRVEKDLFADEAIVDFIAGNERILFLEGVAGAGKSTFLRRIFKDRIESLYQRCSTWESKDIMSGLGVVPLFYSLRNLNGNTKLVDRLTNRLERAKTGNEREQLFDLPESEWLVILDGLDECAKERLGKLIDEIRELVEAHNSLKIIISCRPSGRNWSELFQSVPLASRLLLPLDDTQIKNILASRVSEPKSVETAFQWIDGNPEIKEILHWPMYLVAGYDYLVPQTTNQIDLDSSTGIAQISSSQSDAENPISTAAQGVSSEGESPTPFFVTSTEDIIFPEPETEERSKDQKTDNLETSIDNQFEINLRESILLDRVIQGLINRECDKYPSIRSKAVCWHETIKKKAWSGGDEQHPYLWDEASSWLTLDGLDWFLNLGILREQPTYKLVFFLNYLVRCYFAASHYQSLKVAGRQKELNEYLASCTDEFYTSVIKMAGDLLGKDLTNLARKP